MQGKRGPIDVLVMVMLGVLACVLARSPWPPAALVLVASIVSFVCYGYDKSQARQGGRRVPEATLHVLALIGGWPGAWFGQRAFRHKTVKTRFRLVFALAALTHLALLGWWSLPDAAIQSLR
ncbi:hypothetical protein GCM10007350_17910 [Jeongeupia chitinilytica]|uniref:DUF1294 domain-containing protein n=2 Tax=Jeongeupia chitinilytica TaxID=1041641 RepID=A0ABQ3H1Y4_9NEIS|nr:hypothetical protein GCM10007350_17910 [Jeongeupia chitinilytica]